MTAKEEEQKRKKKKKKMCLKDEIANAADAVEEDEDFRKNKKKEKKKKKKRTEEGAVNDGIDSNKPEKRSSGGKLITDARFSAVHLDPRFQRLPKHHSKVTIDSRFRTVFSHKDFSSSSAPLDKRGKPRKLHPKDHPLLHYYRHEGVAGDRDNDADCAQVRALSSASSSSSDSELSVDEGYASASSSDDSIEEDDVEEPQVAAFDVDPKNIFQEDIPTIEQETHRLAVVNLDWKYVKAVDLYVLLSSCLPKDGHILSVAIYPSEYGLKRMEEEALNGPIALFEGENKQEEEEEDNDDGAFKERLREYERNTLRYYYAVVECDSSATADYLYKTCDGIELERSSNVLDLRFIPDSLEFKHPPHDVATEAPTNYQVLDFHTPALQRTNIQLSWDEDEPQRKILKRKFNSEQLTDMDLKEFLASDDDQSSGSDDVAGDEAMPDCKSQKLKKVDMYRSLIQSGDGSDADEENNKDMEVTFNTGLEDISKRILEKKDQKSETVWEAYLRKRREKKKAKARKRDSKYSSEDDSSDDSDVEVPEGPDDFFVEETSDTAVKTGEKSRKDTHKKSDHKMHLKERKPSPEAVKEQEASVAELELLLADDQGADHLKGYNLKSKKHKGKKGKETLDDDNIPSIADDPRFSAAFTSPLFALDPTDPQFRRSAAYMRQLRQKQKGSEKGTKEGKETQPPKHEQFSSDDVSSKNQDSLQPDNILSKNDKHELASLVRRVKRRVGSLQS